MRFSKGVHYSHPPRGPGRRQYDMTDAAPRARRCNLSKARKRSEVESLIIKRLIWQSCFGGGQRPSQRALARQLGVWPSYIHKVLRKAKTEGMEALHRHGRVTLADLDEARQFIAKLGKQEPGLLVPAPRACASDGPRYTSADDTQREAQVMIRQAHEQNPGTQRMTWQEHQARERSGGHRSGLFRW